MRRRLNLALFDPGVLFGLTVAREATDSARVDPGIAVDRCLIESQGCEIVFLNTSLLNLGIDE